jgi:hypothetical protein
MLLEARPMSKGVDYPALLPLVTADRMRSYLRATSGDLDAAFTLYEWNMRMATSVLLTVGMVEIVVRNAMDRAMTRLAVARHWSSWLDEAPLDARGRDDITRARDRATRHGRLPEVHGKVVAELSFGFWRYLAVTRYLTTLWTPALHAAFPHGPGDKRDLRGRVDHALGSLLIVRNRAAHHEPLHRRDLARDTAMAVEIASWIAPEAGQWVRSMSGLDDP